MPQDEGIRTVSGQTGMNHTLFQEEAEPLRQTVQEGDFAASGAGEGEPARQEAGMGEFAEQLEPSRDLSLYVKDAREIDWLMAGAGFDAVLDRDGGKISAIRFEMLQKQPFEEVLRATPGERREAGRAFLRRLKANQISPEAFRPQGEAAEQARDSARMYGAFFRTAGERLRAYALPEGDLKDPGFLASRAGELYALRESLKDYAGSQRLLRELPGFEEGFLEQGGLDLEQFEAPMDVMRCFAGAALQSLDPEGLGERRGLGESLARQVAGRLFLDAYGELLAGRSAADICDGFGNRELACLLNFTGTAEYMTGRLLEQDPESRERCLAYLQGGEPPLSAASVEEELRIPGQCPAHRRHGPAGGREKKSRRGHGTDRQEQAGPGALGDMAPGGLGQVCREGAGGREGPAGYSTSGDGPSPGGTWPGAGGLRQDVRPAGPGGPGAGERGFLQGPSPLRTPGGILRGGAVLCGRKARGGIRPGQMRGAGGKGPGGRPQERDYEKHPGRKTPCGICQSPGGCGGHRAGGGRQCDGPAALPGAGRPVPEKGP